MIGLFCVGISGKATQNTINRIEFREALSRRVERSRRSATDAQLLVNFMAM